MTAAAVLRKHSSVPSLHAIMVEAEGIMGTLASTLRARLADFNTPSERMLESIRLLKDLEVCTLSQPLLDFRWCCG